MTEGKESLLTQIVNKIKGAVEEAISGINAKTTIDAAAVIGFVVGALLIGIAIQYMTAVTAVPGVALVLLGIGRLMNNIGAFKPSRY